MKLTKKDKLAIRKLFSIAGIMSNMAFNLYQKGIEDAHLCRDICHKWDHAYADAKEAIRKLQLPPF